MSLVLRPRTPRKYELNFILKISLSVPIVLIDNYWSTVFYSSLVFYPRPSSSIEIAMAVSAGYAAGSSEGSTGGVYRQKKASTLHREKELRSVIYNGSDSSEEEEEAMMSPMSLPDSSGQDRWHTGIEHRQSLPFEVCRREVSLLILFFICKSVFCSLPCKGSNVPFQSICAVGTLGSMVCYCIYKQRIKLQIK